MLGVTKSIFKDNLSHLRRYKVTNTGLNINDMPHPKGLPFIGTKLDLFVAGSGSMLHEYIDSRHKKLGPIFYEKLGGNTKLVFVSDPNMMKMLFLKLEGKYPMHILPEPWVLYEKLYGSKRGLFFMDGEEWLTNRRIMNKHLLRENSDKWLEGPIKATIHSFVQKWRRQAEDGSFVPKLESDLYKLSIEVLICILLGSESFNASQHNEELLNMFSEAVKKIFHTTTKLYGLPVHWCQRLNTKAWKEFKESVDLSIFLAQKIVRELLKNKQNTSGLIPKLRQDNMPDEIITRIVADFVIAAGDTTAYTTLWALLLLSKNDAATNELLKDPTQAKHIVKETMRLYPVAPFLTRILPKDCLLGPYTLNEGVLAAVSFYAQGSYQKSIGSSYLFNMSQPTFSRCLHEVTNALNNPEILRTHIKFPSTREERENIMERFMDKFGFPGIIGCIDGTHVALIRPVEHEETFFNRKSYHSLNVLITPIIASIYTSGRDSNNFTQANSFLPYRWDRKDPRQKEIINHVNSASLPFAFGSRSCIGKKIAMIQLTNIITQVVNNFELSCENTSEVTAITSQVLVPKQDVILKLTIRMNK